MRLIDSVQHNITNLGNLNQLIHVCKILHVFTSNSFSMYESNMQEDVQKTGSLKAVKLKS